MWKASGGRSCGSPTGSPWRGATSACDDGRAALALSRAIDLARRLFDDGMLDADDPQPGGGLIDDWPRAAIELRKRRRRRDAR